MLAEPYLDKTAAANTSILGILVEVDRTSKNQSSKFEDNSNNGSTFNDENVVYLKNISKTL